MLEPLGRPHGRTWLIGAILFLAVHGEALLRHPHQYLTGLFWLTIGKRVRGRNQLSALIGASRMAYDLWIARREARDRTVPEPAEGKTPFLVMIDARSRPEYLPQTLRSLHAAGETELVMIIGEKGDPMPADHNPLNLPLCRSEELADLYPGIKRAEGAWLLMLSAGDCLAPGAISYLAQAAAKGSSVCYADDDLVDRDGRRHTPHFKPDWNAELFRHHDYLSGAAAVRLDRALLDALPVAGDRDWIAAMTRTAVSLAQTPPSHVHRILIHRQDRPQPTLPKRTRPEMVAYPKVTVIIPTRNQLDLLKACLKGLEQTSYPGIECIIVDNGSDDPAAIDFIGCLNPRHYTVLRRPGPFNYAALNNAAVDVATGEFLCFLNNDVSMIEPDWLHHLIDQARRDEVGAVGARLLYPDGSIQHAGVVLGVGGGAGHAHRAQDPAETGYFDRAGLPQFVSAVTAACMVVGRKKFLAVGGFDPDTFPVAFNDVDLCLKLNARGWQAFYEPRAELVHHESKSRGTDHTGEKRVRFAGELARLKQRWLTDEQIDPFHHPALSRFSEQFVIGL